MLSREREQWVRPPVVAQEPANPAIARWRFRLVAGLLVAAFGLLMLLVFLNVSGVTEEDPGLPIGLGPLVTSPAAPAAP